MINGEPVCDVGWDMADGEVVCRQLRYPGIVSVTSQSHFGSVNSTFAMDDVRCNGTERYIQECQYNPNDNCGSGEGAGVICRTGNCKFNIYIY